jgi:hypothetical protein
LPATPVLYQMFHLITDRAWPNRCHVLRGLLARGRRSTDRPSSVADRVLRRRGLDHPGSLGMSRAGRLEEPPRQQEAALSAASGDGPKARTWRWSTLPGHPARPRQLARQPQPPRGRRGAGPRQGNSRPRPLPRRAGRAACPTVRGGLHEPGTGGTAALIWRHRATGGDRA